MNYSNDSIIALATPQGIGAIAVIRLSGSDAIRLTNEVFFPRNKKVNLLNAPSHSVHLGVLKNGQNAIDEVLITLFKNPHSYTGEDVIEISCHGSVYIQQEIIRLFIDKGIRHAHPGEFSMRAFLNGKMDLSQTEAVADLIDAQSKASKDIALKQLRGGFSTELKVLREELIHFASLIELELDFSEEDVAFADRKALQKLVAKSISHIEGLMDTFQLGNAIKNGIQTTIVGRPNAGKSTLLNTLLNEERAIVTDIPGTTRDTLEEILNIRGIQFRFIDTAGLRKSEDSIEQIGVLRAVEKVKLSNLYIYLFDISNTDFEAIEEDIKALDTNIPYLLVANKTDLVPEAIVQKFKNWRSDILFISAQNKKSIEELKNRLFELLQLNKIENTPTIISNLRHYEALKNARIELLLVQEGIESELSGDLLAVDIRQALHHIGSITGDISSDDILGSIFSKFCIGK